jgi:hypothetical protein
MNRSLAPIGLVSGSVRVDPWFNGGFRIIFGERCGELEEFHLR